MVYFGQNLTPQKPLGIYYLFKSIDFSQRMKFRYFEEREMSTFFDEVKIKIEQMIEVKSIR